MKPLVPNIWFNKNAEEAVNFYVSLIPNSKIGNIIRYGESSSQVAQMPKGSVMTIDFELNGMKFVAINGGPTFKLNEAFSLLIDCDTQEEMDQYYDKLSSDPNSEQCGWVKDKFGLSWQISSSQIESLIRTGEPEKVERLMAAMLPMKRLNIEALKKAYEG